ncbi:MAG: 16S rRNA processing protein RimM [Polaribacter sp.]|jgi:16S rRNA processing protein RimM
MSNLAPANKPIIIGRISGVFGVHGWVKIFSFTEPRDNILTYKPWLIRNKSDWQTMEIVKGRTQGKTLVVQIEGVDDRDKAHALIGCDIAINSEQLRALEENDFYWRDLIGLDVQEVNSGLIGNVQSIMATGANDVLVVIGKDDAGKKREILIPYLLDDVIKKIDLDENRILVDWNEFLDG